jgi:hypothetical protein
MSVTVDYFFNNYRSLESLAKEINACIGCDLKPNQNDPNDLFDRFLSMEFSSSFHNLINDRDLNFEDYQHQIGIRIPAPDGEIRHMQIAVMSIVVSLFFYRLDIKNGILVFDTQRLLAKYTEKELSDGTTGLFDLVSNQSVVFPEQLLNLYKW